MTVESRPRKLTRLCWVLAVLIVLVFAAVGAGLRGGTPGDAQFKLADQIAMTLLGVALAAGLLAFTRPRVLADETGVTVRNVLGPRRFPWEVVVSVQMDDGAPWASLELQDDDTVALLGVQSNDGEQAVEAVLGMRRLLAASREPR